MAEGVPENEAKWLYWAVARFGPRCAYETRQVYAAGPDDDPNSVPSTRLVPKRVHSDPRLPRRSNGQRATSKRTTLTSTKYRPLV